MQPQHPNCLVEIVAYIAIPHVWQIMTNDIMHKCFNQRNASKEDFCIHMQTIQVTVKTVSIIFIKSA